MMNSFNCTGRLTADPKVFEKDGIRRATFSLAVDKDGSWDREKSNANFFDFVAWRNTADYIVRNFQKGDLMEVVDATAITRDYLDSEGNRHRKNEFVVSKAYRLSKRRKTDSEVEPPKFDDEFEEFSEEIIA